ncbi:MAG: hypothetical protein ACOY35_06770 [Bacillota bacterium]
MEDIKKQVILLSLIEKMKESGSWCGETHIQKSVFFLQEMLGVPTQFDFILYKHGPFSFDLRDKLSEMKANMLLDIQSQPYPYGPSYIPGETASNIRSMYPKTYNKYEKQIEFISENLSNLGVAQLERLATALLVTLEEGEDQPVDSRAQKVHQLKPHVPLNQAIDAVQRIDKFRELMKKKIH